MATMAVSRTTRSAGPMAEIWSRAWEMVEHRNIAGDALFVYAVKTTGIFCRPSCPSRRPLRESVEFFATSELACAAGYRACKRCQPGQEHPQQKLIGLACEYIERNLETTITLEALGKVMELSPFHAQRVFRRTLGVTPKQYQQAKRMERFRGELANGANRRASVPARITDAIYESGFSSGSRVYENSAAEMGMTPTEFRKNARGVKISFGIAESPLGKVLVAVTGAGVCAVAFGDLESELEDDLRGRFALAEIRRDDTGLGETLRRVGRATERASTGSGVAARHPGDGLSAPCVDGAAGDSARRDPQLRPGRLPDRAADRGAGGGAGLRFESGGGGHSLPSRGGQRWEADRLPLGS